MGVPNSEARYSQYPHEFSGGMRQRAMIAMAIANEPKLLIADEPTTALDVTIQAQVIEVLKAQEETHAATILITHDLGLVAELCDRVAVMYAGRIVEMGDIYTIFASPVIPTRSGSCRACRGWLPRTSGSADHRSAAEHAQHAAGLPVPPALLPVAGPAALSYRRARARAIDERAHLTRCHYADEPVWARRGDHVGCRRGGVS